jgi:hypothetical protein
MNSLTGLTGEQWRALAVLDNTISPFGLVSEVGRELENPGAQWFVDTMEAKPTGGPRQLNALGILRGVLLARCLGPQGATLMPANEEWRRIADRYDGLPFDDLALVDEIGMRSGDWDAQRFADSVHEHDAQRGLAGGDAGATHAVAVVGGVIMAERHLRTMLNQAP